MIHVISREGAQPTAKGSARSGDTRFSRTLAFSIALAAALLVAGIAASAWIAFLRYQADIARGRDRITLETNRVRANLSRELYADINLTQGLIDLTRIQCGIRRDQFDAMAREIIGHSAVIRNIALAPGNTVRFLYPVKGNEKALGLDYLANAQQSGAVLRAMRERQTVVAGPVRLIQGGVGIIGRTPIFLPDSCDGAPAKNYWGMASTVIDFDSLMRAAGMGAIDKRLSMALRGMDGTGAPGGAFWGDTGIFASNPVTADIALPSGSWILAAAPREGWPGFSPLTSLIFYTGAILAALLSALFFQLIRVNKGRAEAIAALERERSGLELRVAQRTEELLRAKEAAEAADRIKSAFLATMSHELRTPLNSIIGFTGMILQGLVGEINEEQKKQLGMVRDSAHHLLALINDVLDISKIEAGQIELHEEIFPLDQSLEKCINLIKPQADKKSLAMVKRFAAAGATLRSDRRRVEQMVINLLNNAVKFTETGVITLTTNAGSGVLEIAVIDTGIGIRAEDMEKLYKPFRQIDTGTTRRYEGTGLGLSICKKLAGLLGGDLRAHSDGLGKGSTFTISLPYGEKN